MMYHLTNLTDLDDEAINKMLSDCKNVNNQDIVLQLLRLANNRFGLAFNLKAVRGASYLKAAYTIMNEYRDVHQLNKVEMMALNGIGDHISDEIIHYLSNKEA